MFQFRRFPTYAYLIQRRLTEYCSAGFPHSEICGSKLMCSSPQLIAACHVLLRLLMPRHSPCALISLTLVEQPLQLFSIGSWIMQASQKFLLGSLFLPFYPEQLPLFLKFPQFAFALCCLLHHSSSTLFSFQGTDLPAFFKTRLKRLIAQTLQSTLESLSKFPLLPSFSKERKWWA